jgi:hypothetical protein
MTTMTQTMIDENRVDGEAVAPKGNATARVLRLVLALALVTSGAANALAWRQAHRHPERAAAVVARQEALNFFSLDYRHVHDDTDKVLALASGAFENTYKSQRSAVEAGVTSKQLVVTAEVADNGVAIEYVRGSDVSALVAVDATTTTTSGAKEVTRYRARLELAHTHSGWRVTQFNQIG